VTRLDRAIASLVYASAALGVLFLYVLHGILGFPSWLFYSIAGGEGLWIICSFATYRGLGWARYMAVVLAVVTLGVSLPQPTHYTFAEAGQVVDFLIFAAGSVLQFALIAAVALSLLRSRRG
jgi:hypothetical protein